MAHAATILDDRASWLSGRESNITSQFGEDGLIAATLGRLGSINRWCFEVGANDGEFYSNVNALWRTGWDAVLIESESEPFAKLQHYASQHVRCIQAKVGPDSLDQILSAAGAPTDMDLGVIDVDGQDYWVWKGMEKYRPRIMLVEFAHRAENSIAYIPACGDESNRQASYAAILELGHSKGYVALAKTCVNLLFARKELLES